MKKLFFLEILKVIAVPLIIIFFFLPNLLNGKIPIPADDLLALYHPFRDQSIDGYNQGKFPAKNPLITDPVLQIYPWKYALTSIIKNGQLPLWNPYSFSGQPLLANIQSSVFSIFNILYFILPFKAAWTLTIILPLALTALFMFLFLKDLELGFVSSFFASIILPFSGFYMVWWEWGIITSTAMWLPLILLSINKLFKKSSLIWVMTLTLALTQTIFSGHWQTALYVYIAATAFALYRYSHQRKIYRVVPVVLVFVIAVIISSIQIIPSVEFIIHSSRSTDQSYFPGRKDWFIPPEHMLQLLSPDFFGNPARNNYWGTWNYAEFVSYIGILPLVFSLFALFYFNKSRSFFVGILLFGILTAIENPFSKLIYLYKIPIISSMQPSRAIFLIDFSLVVLAGFGLKDFLAHKIKLKYFIPIIILTTIIGAALFITYLFPNIFPIAQGINVQQVALKNLIPSALLTVAALIIWLIDYLKVNKKVVIFFIITITLFDLFRFAQRFTPFSKGNWISPTTTITSIFQAQNNPFRIMATDRRIFHPNISTSYDTEDVAGYDPLYIDDYGKFVSAWVSKDYSANSHSYNRIITPQNINSKMIDFLNIKYILSFDTLTYNDFNLINREGETYLYQNTSQLPRAYFVNEVVNVKNSNDELERIFAQDTDLSKQAFATTFGFPPVEGKNTVFITNYNSQSLKVKTESKQDRVLVVSNVYYPGWRAYIDGSRAEIKKVNYMFQALIVPRGNHEILFKYLPESFIYGLLFSIIGTMLLGMFSLFLWKRQSQ